MKYCVVEIFVVFHAVPALGFMLSKFELLTCFFVERRRARVLSLVLVKGLTVSANLTIPAEPRYFWVVNLVENVAPRAGNMSVSSAELSKLWRYYLLDMSTLQVRSSRVDRCDRRFYVPGVSPVYDSLL